MANTSRALLETPMNDDVTRRVPGEPGLWILLFGDMAFFAGLFAMVLNAGGSY